LKARRFAFLLPLCALAANVHYAHSQAAQDEPEIYGAEIVLAYPIRGWDEHQLTGFGETLRAGAFATGYTLLSNATVMLFNRFVTQVGWAFPNAATIRRNFTEPWKWEETDGFMVNHIGHPMQGWTYFSAGRAMGFGFYQSIFFSAFGSFTWEAFGEGLGGSFNDLIVTTFAGVSLGEMMHRLYAQAHSAGAPAFLTVFLNPAAGLHRLLTGWEPPVVDNNFYEIRTYLAAGFGHTDYRVSEPAVLDRDFYPIRGPFLDAGFRIIYGDPFVQNTWVPFRHFELHASFGADFINYVDFRLFSSGMLFSFSALHTDAQALSHGLSLHYDFASLGEFGMYDATINMYSNSLGWTVNYRHLFPRNVGWRSRTHAGVMFFGASNFFLPSDDRQTEIKNYGYGISLKHLSSLEIGARARFDANAFFYFMWTYPQISALSEGFVRWKFIDLSFSYLVSRSVSLGTTFSIATERGWFGEFPSTRKNHWSVRTFVAWNGQNIRGR